MDTGDDRVCGNNKTLPSRAIYDSCVIEQAETAWPGERREKAPNALELAESFSGEAVRHGS
jgi:predicted nucleotidyltransferase